MKIVLKRISFILFVVLSISFFPAHSQHSFDNIDPVDLVNPYMGNISHLLVPTYPTIHLPNSLLRVYPERRDFTGDLLSGLPLMITSHRGSSAFNLSPFQGSEEKIRPVILTQLENFTHNFFGIKKCIDLIY